MICRELINLIFGGPNSGHIGDEEDETKDENDHTQTISKHYQYLLVIFK